MQDNNMTQHQPKPTRILVFSSSLRRDSYNTKLAKLAAEVIEKNKGIADYAMMSEFDAPSYNQDVEDQGIKPEGITELRNRLLANDAYIIASPEYNGSVPGHLKNVIDWVSRFRPQPFNERHGLLMSASPSMVGGNRALWALRVPLEHLGSRVFPDMFSLAMAHKAFNEESKIADTVLAKRFEDNIVAFMSLVEAAKNYPCLKKAWVEFLGETPDPVKDRVE